MSLARVAIHSSQFPDAVRLDLLESLRSRKINHKFHYDSLKQTQKWLALHRAYSPSRTDPQCAAVYQQSFACTVQRLQSSRAHVVGLGCGGGQKDTAFLELIHQSGREVFYTPSDVSTAMVLVAQQTALRVVPEANCFPLVCDLATAQDLPAILPAATGPSKVQMGDKLVGAQTPVKVFTFFGMIPNFEPDVILPKLASLLQPDDHLLFSANLAPGSDYAAGVERVLPLYDNALTRDWLMTFLLDLGVERADGELGFQIEKTAAFLDLRRITATFTFVRDRMFEVESQRFEFRAGETVRLFYSYRHTPALVRTLLAQHGLEVLDQWVTPSQEEGVFLVTKAS